MIEEKLPDGRTRLRSSEVTELATGMHKVDRVTGEFADASDEIVLTEGGAIALNTVHNVSFAADILGGVELLTPDAKRLRFHFAGVALWDTATGKAVLFPAKSSVGQLLRNEVTFPDCVEGLNADVRYVNTLAGFSQSVIFRNQLDVPFAAFGFNEATTRILAYTEIDGGPEPVKLPTDFVEGGKIVPDEYLDFGALKIGRGMAFSIDGAVPGNITVSKSWIKVQDGRRFLIEGVPFHAVRAHLNALPIGRQEAQKKKPEEQRAASVTRVAELFAFMPAKKGAAEARMQVAKVNQPAKGFLLDFESYSAGNTTNFTFEASKTYYISGDYHLYLTTTIQPCVIKFAPTNSARLTVHGTVSCQTRIGAPAILTARDDASVGEPVGTNSTPTGFYADEAFHFMDYLTPVLSNLKICYAKTALAYWNGSGGTNSHVQIVHCQTGFRLISSVLALRNLLLYDVQTNFWNDAAFYSTVRAEHLTVNGSQHFALCPGGSLTISLTNAILASIASFGTGYDTYSSQNVQLPSDPTLVFQTVGAAANYLLPQYQPAANTNINSSLLGDFQQCSVRAPVFLTNLISANAVLAPTVPRMSANLTCGYAYPALDFVTGGTSISNCTVTVQPGTVIGAYNAGNSVAIVLDKSANLNCEGSPTNIIHVCRYNSIQEQASTNWANASPGWIFGPGWWNPTPAPSAGFRFVDFFAPSGSGWHVNGYYGASGNSRFTDCQFHGSGIEVLNANFFFTNCLFEAVWFYLEDATGPLNLTFQNNLFYGGVATNWIEHVDSGTWRFRDNLFYKTRMSGDYPVDGDYNAYLTNFSTLPSIGTHDLVLTNSSIAFQAGPLGSYYLPTNSLLINRGSTTADQVGLYHYTTRADQFAEGTSQVDIGFHYLQFGSVASTNRALFYSSVKQSSTNFGGNANYAVDGVTGGDFNTDHVTHTGPDAQAWWQVDLGSIRSIDTIRIWNRTDCCSDRLTNSWVLVSSDAFTSTNLATSTNQSGVFSYHLGSVVTSNYIPVFRTGRYVRVQLAGTDYLSLAEVQIMSAGVSSDLDGDGLWDYKEDSNGNGVKDSTETDPANVDSDGDGVSDYIEILQGRNPNQAGWVPDSSGVLNLETFIRRR